jgi:serine protease Do
MPGKSHETVADSDGAESNLGDALTGVAVTVIDAAARRQFNLLANLRGALITNVDPASAAYQTGLRPGDVLQQIDLRVVTTAADAMYASRNAKYSQVLVWLWSQGGSRFMVIEERKTL